MEKGTKMMIGFLDHHINKVCLELLELKRLSKKSREKLRNDVIHLIKWKFQLKLPNEVMML